MREASLMANSTFVVADCRARKNVLVTQSAKRARDAMRPGLRIEVWNSGRLVEKIYYKELYFMAEYCIAEKEYHRQKQRNHEMRNERRRSNGKPESESGGVATYQRQT